MKKEFLSSDHDHVAEIRAGARKQGAKEKFHDYFFEMQNFFNSLTEPFSEAKKFEIVFRNMRSDYKGYAVARNINNLADLKNFGRKLDATFWYKYHNAEDPSLRTRANVNELRTGTKPKEPFNSEMRYQKTRNFYRSQNVNVSDEENPLRHQHTAKEKRERNIKSAFEGNDVLLATYILPKEGMCFNCRLPGHQAKKCRRPKHQYCTKCGFHNVDTKNCPYCAKNEQ